LLLIGQHSKPLLPNGWTIFKFLPDLNNSTLLDTSDVINLGQVTQALQ